MDQTNQRERLGSRLGFILLSAGCAIGVGNVWKFPYMVGQYGGAAFVLFYVLFLLLLGIPVMTVEFSLGRAARKSPVKMYQELEPKGSKWHLHGYLAMAGNYILMMFYTTVSGWMLYYFFATAFGKLDGLDKVGVDGHFDGLMGDPLMMLLFMGIVVVLGFAVCSFGLQKGIEKITKYMMLALLVLIIVLAVYSIASDKSGEGLKFYLLPDFDKMMDAGILNVLVAAMSQAFFTLSIGIGNMAIFGSYIGKDRSLMGEAVNVAALDTFVAFTSGLIIFPACFAHGIQPNAGPPLIFQTLPNVFNKLPAGRFFGSVFFLFLTFAAFSTILTVFENIIACNCDLFGISRRKACAINTVAIFALSVPCVLGFNVLSGFKPFGDGTNVLDLEDFIVSNVLLPLGSLIFVVFACHKCGFGWNKFRAEANEGKGLKFPNWLRIYMQFILPVIIIALFVVGIVTKFI